MIVLIGIYILGAVATAVQLIREEDEPQIPVQVRIIVSIIVTLLWPIAYIIILVDRAHNSY